MREGGHDGAPGARAWYLYQGGRLKQTPSPWSPKIYIYVYLNAGGRGELLFVPNDPSYNRVVLRSLDSCKRLNPHSQRSSCSIL